MAKICTYVTPLDKVTLVKASYGDASVLSYGGKETVYIEQEVEKLIETLKSLKKEYSKDYSDFRLGTIRDCGCYHDCDCAPSYVLMGYREQVPVELEYEALQKKISKERAEERDRREFARLQEKYGK